MNPFIQNTLTWASKQKYTDHLLNMDAIHEKESLNEQLVSHTLNTPKNLRIDHVETLEDVVSTLGKVEVHNSTLGSVTAGHYIELINSSAKKVKSHFEHVLVKRTDQKTSKISSIHGAKTITITQASVTGKTKSILGDIVAHQSTLNNVTAWKDVTLINSSAENIQSRLSNVTVKQTDGNTACVGNIKAWKNIKLTELSVSGKIKASFGTVVVHRSTLNTVKAQKNIVLIDSSANQVESLSGHIVIKQTDATPKFFTQIIARNTVIIRNSEAKNITLHLNPSQQGFLDLTNTTVSGLITVKVEGVFQNKTNWLFSWMKQLAGIEPIVKKTNTPQEFTLLIQARTLPKNLFFEGFDTNEISVEMTENNILVTGKKK